MDTAVKKRSFLKFSLWFIFLSTLGVGGGIFFLLFVVVPIEQMYENQGWSQFKIDAIMKYFVIGWIIFGFFASFIYYLFVVKKNRWKTAWSFVVATVCLCVIALYYFFNTGTALVQTSQGTVEEGERITFGPYPEGDDLKRLKEEGYDGVITLLSPVVPIESPLLEKEKKGGEEAEMPIHSFPMLPWVGDNTDSLNQIKKLIEENEDKRYYIHCYLGRHRVDVVKQAVQEVVGDSFELKFLLPGMMERGSLYKTVDASVLLGPYPTDEEWFTRVKRSQVKEVVSLMDPTRTKWYEKEKKVTEEMDLIFTSKPVSPASTIEEIQAVAHYIKQSKHKLYVHDFINPTTIEMLEAYLSWGKTLHNLDDIQLDSGSFLPIGQKAIVGYAPTESDRKKLTALGIEKWIPVSSKGISSIYELVLSMKNNQQLTYFIVNDEPSMQKVERIATGMLYGSRDRGDKFEINLTNGDPIVHDRNIVVGPKLVEEEYVTYLQKNGVAQLIFLYSSSTATEEDLTKVKELAKKHHIPFLTIPMKEAFENDLFPILDQENGLIYIMTESDLVAYVEEYIDEF